MITINEKDIKSNLTPYAITMNEKVYCGIWNKETISNTLNYLQTTYPKDKFDVIDLRIKRILTKGEQQ